MAKGLGSQCRLAVVAIMFAMVVSAQQRNTPPPTKAASPRTQKFGIVSGRVFLVTNGGDLKHARLAETYLLYQQRNVTLAEMTEAEKNQEKAVVVWLKARIEAMQASMKVMQSEPTLSDSARCRGDLLGMLKALGETLRWAEDNPIQAKQVIGATADEEGNFKMSAPPGRYQLVAHGRAGFYNAFWYSGLLADIIVEPGKETTIKLGTAEKACFDPN